MILALLSIDCNVLNKVVLDPFAFFGRAAKVVVDVEESSTPEN